MSCLTPETLRSIPRLCGLLAETAIRLVMSGRPEIERTTSLRVLFARPGSLCCFPPFGVETTILVRERGSSERLTTSWLRPITWRDCPMSIQRESIWEGTVRAERWSCWWLPAVIAFVLSSHWDRWRQPSSTEDGTPTVIQMMKERWISELLLPGYTVLNRQCTSWKEQRVKIGLGLRW